MLSLAGGDSAGGDHESGYASVTQQAVVLAYHLLMHGEIDRDGLAHELAELHGDDRDPSVIRAPSPAFHAWLRSMAEGDPVLATDPSVEPAARVAPVGIWFRRDPDAIVASALSTARLTHLDGPTAVATTAAAGAVAAACFAQNGRDLCMAVAETAQRAAEQISSQEYRFARTDAIDELLDRFRSAVSLVGSDPERLEDEVGADPLGGVVVGLTMAAPVDIDPEPTITTAAEMGGSELGALVGAVVGARTGVRPWPWPIPNHTWFVALGQRLAEGRRGLDELPVPYAVEQRVTYPAGTRRI